MVRKMLSIDRIQPRPSTESVGQLAGIQTLSVGTNQLPYLPESLVQFAGLQTLRVGHDWLTSWPGSLGLRAALRTSHIRINQLMGWVPFFPRLNSALRIGVPRAGGSLPGSSANRYLELWDTFDLVQGRSLRGDSGGDAGPSRDRAAGYGLVYEGAAGVGLRCSPRSARGGAAFWERCGLTSKVGKLYSRSVVQTSLYSLPVDLFIRDPFPFDESGQERLAASSSRGRSCCSRLVAVPDWEEATSSRSSMRRRLQPRLRAPASSVGLQCGASCG